MLFSRFFKWLLPLAILLFVQPAIADVVVIVSAKSPVVNLSADQVAKIFLGKSTSFPNQDPAYPIDQPM